MKNEPIKIGVVGLGRAGWAIHIKALRDRSDFKITAVADPDPERRAQAEKELGCQAFASRDELLASADCDVVAIATPNPFHEDDAIAVAESGRHCVLEKPIAAAWAGARRVEEAFKKSGRMVFPHQQHLVSSEHLLLRDLFASGKLGEIFEIRYHWVSYGRRNDWQTLKKNGGGLLTNHGSHALSTILELLGAPVTSLSGQARHIKDAGDADDHDSFILQAENGRNGVLMLSTSCAAPMPRFVILGTTGSAWADSTPGKVCLKYYNAGDVPKLEVLEGAAPGRSYGTGESLPWKEETLDITSFPALEFYENVAAVLREGAKPAITIEATVEIARVLEWGATGADPAQAES